MIKQKDIDRFLTHVAKNSLGGCWLWTAARRGAGYAAFNVRSRPIDGHRFSYAAFRGPIPEGIHVCHTCDVRHCVNPDHLFLGTARDNMQDAKRKGRMSPPPRNIPWTARFPERVHRGSKNANAIITEAQALQILQQKAAGKNRSEIAAELGIKRSQVDDIVNGRAWRHVHALPGAPTPEQLASARQTKPGAKISADLAREIKRRLAAGETGLSIAQRFGLHKASVSDIKRGLTWRDA